MVRRFQRGAMSLQMLVLMVPVVLGLMGFGLDLGRLYLVKGELNQAAEAMAQAAAARLIGTDAAPDNATSAARRALDNANGHGNKYNFGSLVIGESTGFLASEVQDPFYYDSAAAAIGEDSAAQGGEAAGSTAKHVRVNISAEAPLLFWGVLSLGQERKTRIAAQAAAGISAPLCVACGIEPLAIAALSQDDTTDFGFTVGTKYTFGYQCTGLPNPAPLTGGSGRLPYLILNRLNEETTVEEGQQLYRIGAQGLPGSTNSALSCIAINAEEQVWASATPIQCNMNQVPNSVRANLCGLASRFQPDAPAACPAAVTDVDTLVTSYTPDTDTTDLDDYTQYAGTGRRLITVPIVDSLVAAGPMVVLGFRQFLVEPAPGDTTLLVADQNGRFNALYLGSVAPVKQGRFDGCQATAGPGKVVLHR